MSFSDSIVAEEFLPAVDMHSCFRAILSDSWIKLHLLNDGLSIILSIVGPAMLENLSISMGLSDSFLSSRYN